MKAITQRWLPSRDNYHPVLLYGWPFDWNYFLEYAKRHRLSLKVPEEDRTEVVMVLDDSEVVSNVPSSP